MGFTMKITHTLIGQFNVLCWLIFTVKDVVGEPSIHFVETAFLKPPPYRLNDEYLLHMDFREHKKLCTEMLLEIHSSNFSSETSYTPKLNQIQSYNPPGDLASDSFENDEMPSYTFPPGAFSYVPKAHVYKFDDKEEWLAIRCPTLPPFYLSHEMVNQTDHHWHIRIIKPAIEHYNFQFETVMIIDEFDEHPIAPHLPSENHYFYQMDTLKRWYLCSEARRITNYEIEMGKNLVPERAKVYTFRYSKNWTEDYLTIVCFGGPEIYLRSGDLKGETNVIVITLLEDEYEQKIDDYIENNAEDIEDKSYSILEDITSDIAVYKE